MRLFKSLMPYAGFVLLSCLTVLIYGYHSGSDPNLAQLLPFIVKLQHPYFFPTDPYVSTVSSFPSIYPYVMALLGGLAPLSLLNFCFALLLRSFLFWVVYRMAMLLFRKEKVAWMACFLASISPLISISTPLGEDPIMKNALYHTSFSGPFVLLSLLWFFERKYIRSFALAAVLYWVCGLAANFLVIIYLVHSVLNRSDRRRVIMAWLVFALLMVPFGAWYFSLPRLYSGFVPDLARIIRMWYPGHYFPLSWSMSKWLSIIAIIPLMWLAILGASNENPLRGKLKNFLYAMGFMWAAAFVAGELFGLRQVIVLQLLRSDSIFVAVGLVCASYFIVEWVENVTIPSLGMAVLIGLAFTEISQPGYAIYVPVMFAAWQYENGRYARLAAGFFLIIILLDMILLNGATGKGIVAACAFTAFLIPSRKFTWTVLRTSPRRCVFLCLAFLIPLAPAMFSRLYNRSLDFNRDSMHAWIDVQRWAGTNTAPDAVFIVPLKYQGFRVYSNRSPFVEWVDAAALHWAPGFEREWVKRVTLLLGTDMVPFSTASPEELDSRRSVNETVFRDIAARYGVRYAVLDASAHRLLWPVAYRNDTFTVYVIPGQKEI